MSSSGGDAKLFARVCASPAFPRHPIIGHGRIIQDDVQALHPSHSYPLIAMMRLSPRDRPCLTPHVYRFNL